MTLHMEGVWIDTGWLEEQDRQANAVRPIGELLPFVLARYSIEIQPAPRTDMLAVSNEGASRFASI